MKLTISLIFVAVSVIAGILLVWNESESNSFVNYKSLEESGLIAKGWVPSFTPKSSYNINEHHAVDKPYIYVEFYFKPEEINSFEKSCTLVGENIYKCSNSGYPVSVIISNKNNAIIKSI